MAIVLQNRQVADGVFLMTLSNTPAACGQFYMLKPNPGSTSPLLGRPISVFDCNGDESSFLYLVVGEGTQLLAQKRQGDEVEAIGPLGNGFAFEEGDLCAIGGGIGIAPMYMLIKEWKRRFPGKKTTAVLGFSKEAYMVSAFEEIADEVIVDVGGYVTEKVNYGKGTVYAVCGPTPMLRAAKQKAQEHGLNMQLSLEKRMACGVGACLGCTCATLSGNKRVCKDGPVFQAAEVMEL